MRIQAFLAINVSHTGNNPSKKNNKKKERKELKEGPSHIQRPEYHGARL